MKVKKQDNQTKNQEKVVQFKRIKTDSNFKLHKSVKRLSLSKQQLSLFIDAIENARQEDLRKGKSKKEKDDSVL